MSDFFSGMTGWQKLILIFGVIVLMVGARVLFPEAADWFMTWIEDMVHHLVEFVQGLGE